MVDFDDAKGLTKNHPLGENGWFDRGLEGEEEPLYILTPRRERDCSDECDVRYGEAKIPIARLWPELV